MKFLVISDIHGNTENLEKMKDQFKEADAVLFAGDFTEFGKEETGVPALKKLCSLHDTIFAVNGNCDTPTFLADNNDSISVENSLVSFEGLCIAGCGGGTIFTKTTANEREEGDMIKDFHLVTDEENTQWDNLIAIMHNPPKDTECDKIPNGVHVGSALLKEFVDKVQPLLVVTGHIHESAAICSVGKTTVINPGAVLEGKYAVVEAEKENNEWKIKKAELKSL